MMKMIATLEQEIQQLRISQQRAQQVMQFNEGYPQAYPSNMNEDGIFEKIQHQNHYGTGDHLQAQPYYDGEHQVAAAYEDQQ